MIKLKGISDTIRMLDKYDIDAEYDESKNVYTISDEDFQYMLDSSKNKDYVRNLQVGKGSTLKTSKHRPQLSVLSADIDVESDEIVFTPSGILEILAGVEELEEYDLSLTEEGGTIQLQIGESYYDLAPKHENEVLVVDEDILDTIADIEEEASEDISGDDPESLETIESGPIKEVLKTLLIGGVVRMAKAYLKE